MKVQKNTYYNDLIKNTVVNYGKPTPMAVVGCRIPPRILSVTDTIDYYCQIMNINFEQLKNPSRKRETLRMRQMIMHFIAKRLNRYEYTYFHSSLIDIGRIFGKDHATVIHSRNTIDNDIETNKQFATYYREIESRLLFMLNIAK